MTSYIDDLVEQNKVLVHTVQKLESVANERVATLEDRLQLTSHSAKVIFTD